MNNTPVLKELRTEPVDNVIDLLESKLEEARKGDIRAVALICVEKGDVVGTCWELGDGGTYLHQLTAGAMHLQFRLCNSAVGNED